MSTHIIRLLIITSYLLGLFYLNSCLRDDIKRDEITFTPGDTIYQLVLKTEVKNIYHLSLLIKGEIKGTGQLSIAENDSKFYKTYELKAGKVKINYDGDWYSNFCTVTYKPKSKTTGQLKFEGNFIGN